MREHLVALDERFAFSTSLRFDLLAAQHVPHLVLGARDVEGAVARAIERAEGVTVVTGRIGSGKSSVLAAVTDGLDEGFVPLRVSVVGVEAGDPAAFARHAIREIGMLPDTQLTSHERHALARATATEAMDARWRELRAGLSIRPGPALIPSVVGDIKRTAIEELRHDADPAEAVAGLQRLFDVFWAVGRCPVLVVDDTDHWGGAPAVADRFFDQTARALGRLDAALLVAAQRQYTRLEGYGRIRQTFTAEVALPALPDAEDGIARVLGRRIDRELPVATVESVFEPDALRLLAQAYEESVDGDDAGDMRRTVTIARHALELAVDEPGAERISPGHVQEAMARNPLGPESGLVAPPAADAAVRRPEIDHER